MSSSLELGDIGLNSAENLSVFRYDMPIGNVKLEAFNGNGHIEDVCVSAAESIADYAFNGCYGLTSLDLPGIANYESLDVFGGADKHSYFTKLAKITIAEGTEKIGSLLANLPALEYLEVPDTLQSISENAFISCNSLHDLKFGHGIALGTGSLKGMNSLTSIEFPILPETASDVGAAHLANLSHIKVLSSDRPFQLKHQLREWKASDAVLEFEGYAENLTALSEQSFASCDAQMIDIHESQLTSIASFAFKDYHGLIKLPTSVKILELDCFSGVDSFDLDALSNVMTVYSTGTRLNASKFPSTVTSIQESAFMDSHFDSGVVALGDDTNYIGQYAFSRSDIGYASLDSSTLTSVPVACFANSPNLTAVSIAGSYSTIAPSAFIDSIDLEHVDFGNVKHIGAYAFKNTALASDSSNSIDIQAIESIGNNAFQNCNSLANVTLSPKVISGEDASNLGDTIFNSCTMLTAITLNVTNAELNDALSVRAGGSLIPASPEVDDVKAVYNRLKNLFIGAIAEDPKFVLYLSDCSIAYDGSGMQYKCLQIEGNVLKKCDKTASDFVKFCKNPVIPSAVTTIAADAFAGIDSQLTSVILHNNVRTIGDRAFKGCTVLADINLSQVQSIGLSAFSHTAIEAVILPDSLASLGQYAFSECESLTSFTIGSSLQTLPTGFIAGSTGVKSVQIPSNIVELQDDALISTSSVLQVKFETQSRDVMRTMLGADNRVGASANTVFYGSDNTYKYPMFICTSTDRIYEVKNRAFNVSIALDLISVDDSMLGYDTITADMLAGLHSINKNAFKGITKTPSIILPVLSDYSDIAIDIKDDAFAGWGSLERIDVAVDYEVFLSKHPILPKWTPALWGVNTSTTLHFRDGILRMTGHEWVFETVVDTFVWTLVDGKKTVWKVNDLCAQTEETIPDDFYAIGSGSLSTTTKIEVLNAQSIIEISSHAFTSNQSIKTVSFGNALSTVANDAFEHSSISAMKFPASIPVVSACGLNRAYFLKELAFSDKDLPYSGTKEIAQSAFINMQAELSSLEFGATLTSIGDYAFAEFETVFPRIDNADFETARALRRIGDYAFFNSIRTLQDNKFIAPPSLSVIGDAAFGYHKEAYTQELSAMDLTPVDGSLRNVTQIGLSAFIRNRFKSIKFNKSGALTSIGDYAFAYPRYKCDLYLPKTITSIGENAFKGNIILNPDAVRKNIISVDTAIGKFAADDYSSVDDSIFKVVKNEYAQAFNRAGFTDHTCLSALKSDYYTGFAYVFQNAMHFCPDSLSIDVLTRTVVDAKTNAVTAFVPAFVDSIGAEAFKDCALLTALSVLNPEVEIEASAFYNCTSLSTINAPGSFMVNDAPDYVFYNCKKLCNIQLLSSTGRIGDYAFAGCSNLSDVWLDSMNELNVDQYPLSSIGDHAFDGCSKLSVFYIFPGIQHIGADSFKDCISLQNIWVYLDDTQFRDIVDPSLTIKEAVKLKFGSVRSDNKCRINFLNSVYMNDGEVKIDDEYVVLREFDSASKLSAVEAVKYWQMVNDNQTYLNLSAISEIDPFAFAECPNIKSLNFLANETRGVRLSSIGDFAFNNCTKLAKVNGNSLSCAVVGDYAFANCESLIRMQFDLELLQSVGQGAFYKTNMNEVRFNAQSMPISEAFERLKHTIHYDSSTNKNPLEVPEFCQFILVASDKTGKYDCLMNDLTYSDVDTCTNQMVFVDKTKDSIKPVLIVKSRDGYLPAIVSNSFHVNVIGRWK